MSVNHLLQQRHDRLVGGKRTEREPREAGDLRLNGQTHRSLQPIELLLEPTELFARRINRR